MEDDKQTTDHDDEQTSAEEELGISRRDVMKAAGASAAIAGGGGVVATGIGAAAADCEGEPDPCTECREVEGCTHQSGSCTRCAGDECQEITGSRINVGGNQHCYRVESFPTSATHAVIKGGQQCHVCPISNRGGPETFCIGEEDSAISHIEFSRCPTADVTADCPNDRLRVDVENTDSVYYEVEYVHCDEANASGTLTFDDDAAGGTEDDWHAFVDVADCEGTVTVYTEEAGTELDAATFDCESASVSVSCPDDEVTITADDTSEVWYEIDYAHCDEADVSRTKLDFGSTDEDTVSIADCEGTITLTDDDENELDSVDFDCEAASVSVVCEDNEATISADDTSQVWYAIDYDDGCSASDVSRTGPLDLSGSTDSTTVSVADCSGTITVTDDDETVLATDPFDCGGDVPPTGGNGTVVDGEKAISWIAICGGDCQATIHCYTLDEDDEIDTVHLSGYDPEVCTVYYKTGDGTFRFVEGDDDVRVYDVSNSDPCGEQSGRKYESEEELIPSEEYQECESE